MFQAVCKFFFFFKCWGNICAKVFTFKACEFVCESGWTSVRMVVCLLSFGKHINMFGDVLQMFNLSDDISFEDFKFRWDSEIASSS